MSKAIEIRLKIQALKKKIDSYEAELELLHFQLDEEEEMSLVK
jgi:hypothetical protein